MVGRIANRLTAWLRIASAASLAAMMLLTCVDVVGRAAGRPLLGAIEVTGLLATLALAASLPYTHSMGAHVGVDLVTVRLGSRQRARLEALTGLASFALFAAVAWKSADYAGQLRASGEVSMTLQLPTYFVVYFIAGSFAVLALVQGLDVAQAAARAAGRKPSGA